MAGFLGRSWKSEAGKDHPRYHAPHDLKLIGEEYLIVKQRLIAQTYETAEATAPRIRW